MITKPCPSLDSLKRQVLAAQTLKEEAEEEYLGR